MSTTNKYYNQKYFRAFISSSQVIKCRDQIVLLFAFIFCILLNGCQTGSPENLFYLLSPDQTGVDFINKLEEDDSFNIIQYLYYYNGGGVAVGDVNNDGYPDIYLASNRNKNHLYINHSEAHGGKIRFQDITDAAGVAGLGNWTTGVSMVDINSDGWLDIYVCQVGGYKNFTGKNQLFINQGCTDQAGDVCQVTFKEQAAVYGLDFSGFSSQSAFFDYDLDGDLDMYLLCHSVHSSESYRDTASTRKRDAKTGDKLFENRGPDESNQIHFLDVSEKAGIIGGIAGYGLGVAIGDLDKNGFPDIYISNDFHENDFVYLNRGNGVFSEESDHLFNHTSYFSMGNDLGDLNNDGWLDLMTLDMKPQDEILYKQAQGPDPYDIYRFKRSFGYHHQFPQNSVQVNQGNMAGGEIRFSDNAQMMGVASTDWSWSTLMADFNLDGWKDLYISNGIPRRPNNLDYLKFISNRQIQENASDLELAAQMPSGKVSNYAYQNIQGNYFEDVTGQWGMQRPSISHGAAYADFDLDGDLDIVVNNLDDPAYIYRNDARILTGHHFISLRLNGPPANPLAIGAKITVNSPGHTQYQELYVTRGWQSSVDFPLIFGLGSESVIDTIRIDWPDQKYQILTGISADQWLDIDYRDAKLKPLEPFLPPGKRLFKSDPLTIPFRHRENTFFDNTREPLIPYLLSTQGPRLAVADVNGDHLEDFYIGGASSQPGALFIQHPEGKFSPGNLSGFANDTGCEDTGLAFFDVDQDGDQDLFVGSGGNQYYQDADKLRDRIYLNDGQGNFTYAAEALPPFYEQTSVVRSFDFDGDGDLDVFIGSRSVALYYGKNPDSHLLINDGQGHFEPAPTGIIDLAGLGMVSDAVWSDIDGDGRTDLLVVGDWMPVVIFKNTGDHFAKRSTDARTLGWWNCIAAADLNRDGHQDLILGNFGSNSNLQASPQMPVRLYLADFDVNLTPDPVVTYYKQGKEFPLLGLDALGSQMVFLKKKFRSYDQFATRTIQEILPPDMLEKAQRKEATTFTSKIALNNGTGDFQFADLPLPVQASSIHAIFVHDFNHDEYPDLLLGGNFYDIQPAIGRMDASYGHLLLNDGNSGFQVIKNSECNLLLEGQIRDLKLINAGNQEFILVARNDAPISCLELNAGS